jgi:hypothetical protein
VANNNDRAAWPYRFELVPLDRLFIDADYQRPLTTFVEKVAADYNPALVGTLVVSERKGHAGRLQEGAIIDGQTRWEGMRRVGESVAPCLIYIGLTPADEAKLFSALQTQRRGMATYLRFRAALVAKDPEAIAIAAIVQQQGFDLDVVETPQTIRSISALEATYRRDPQLLHTVMGVISAAWPDPATEFRTGGDLIRGLGIFLTREQGIDKERLVKRLGSVDPRMVRHRANALMEGGGGGGSRPGYMADAILGFYMRGGRRSGGDGNS